MQLEPAFTPACVSFALVTGVARVASQITLQLVESLLLEVATLALANVFSSFGTNSAAGQRTLKVAYLAPNSRIDAELTLVAFHGLGIAL